MAKNEGKQFEEDFKKSIPKGYWFYRFKDGTAGFSGEKNSNVRFQAHNIADCEVMGNKYLFILELKSHKGSSIPFNCSIKSACFVFLFVRIKPKSEHFS